MKDRIEENGIAYELVGDYYIPVMELPGEECSIGKYGRMYREYLKEYNLMIFNDLVLTFPASAKTIENKYNTWIYCR